MVQPGDSLDLYFIEELLGQGGMGSVFRAHDKRLNRRVAVKVLSPQQIGKKGAQAAAARLLREARSVAAFDHPNAVTIFDVGEFEGSPYIVMEFVDGKTLRKYIAAPGIGWRRKLLWLVDTARALAAAHRTGIVHRDVKPDNVMVRKDGFAKVVDFGIARRAATAVAAAPAAEENLRGSSATRKSPSSKLQGSVAYMAPEQINNATQDGRTDQFAWGVMAYELLSGGLPWGTGGSQAMLAAIMMKEVEPLRSVLPDLPEEIDAVILRTLSKSSEKRFADMDEMIGALEGQIYVPGAERRRESALSEPPPAAVKTAAATLPTTTNPAPATTSGRPESARRPSSVPWILGVSLVAIGIAVGATVARLTMKSPPAAATPNSIER